MIKLTLSFKYIYQFFTFQAIATLQIMTKTNNTKSIVLNVLHTPCKLQ